MKMGKDGGKSPIKFSDPGPGSCGDPPSTPMRVDGSPSPTDGHSSHEGITRSSQRGTVPTRLDGAAAAPGPKGSIKRLGGKRGSGGFKFSY